MMATMSVWHPDIEQFITAKLTPGKLVHFNLSVLITDDFMYAVENDLNWDLIFPDYESCMNEYKQKRKLLIVNPSQFGYTAGYRYYCMYLKYEFDIDFLCIDRGLAK